LVGGSEAFATLNGISRWNAVATIKDHDEKSYAYLTWPRTIPSIDYEASTFAIATECKPISRACGLRLYNGIRTPFHCSNAFYGDITMQNISGTDYGSNGVSFFSNSTFSERIKLHTVRMNPFYFGAWAHIFTQGNRTSGESGTSDQLNHISSDPEIVVPAMGGLSWILNCSATVFDMTYVSINGSSPRPTRLQPTNETMSSILAAPLFYSSFGEAALQTAAYIASSQFDSTHLAASWAKEFSRISMSLSAGVITPRENLQEQHRSTILLAKVPKAPLFLLLLLNCLYAIIGFILAGLAFKAVGEHGTKDVQLRLSVAGLVGLLFERSKALQPIGKIEDMFREWNDLHGHGTKVGVEKTAEGGSLMVTYNQDQSRQTD
jgi:hypothetical protein